MLTKLTIRNFKKFDAVDIELGNPVVFIGPNNSGKTTALQALALWELGLRKWNEKRPEGKSSPEKRPGVAINRRDLFAIPVPDAHLLWRDLHVRDVNKDNGKQTTQNIRIDILVEGASDQRTWKCGLEFDYANEESFHCRPLRLGEGKSPDRMAIPKEALATQVVFLPPMSGLVDREFKKEPGEIGYLIGQGRTGEVLRNLCNGLATDPLLADRWRRVCNQIEMLFGVRIETPDYSPATAEIILRYREVGRSGFDLDLSSAGRGLQQTLLLLTFLARHPGTVVLLDEPDAHLEVLRQRQIYQVLADAARDNRCQIVVASHSEVVLDEAADRDVVVAFVGRPHRIDDRGTQVAKSLKEIGFDQFYQAEQTGWVLYLEGSTDLAILRALARVLSHPTASLLERPFVHYIANDPQRARHHFHGLREGKHDLVGLLLVDKLDRPLQIHSALAEQMWRKREIENYICQPETLLAYAKAAGGREAAGQLFAESEQNVWEQTMQRCIENRVPPAALRNPADPWWNTVKATDDFLDLVFEEFFAELGLPNLMRKTDYHALADFVPKNAIDPEIVGVLDAIHAAAQRAIPASVP